MTGPEIQKVIADAVAVARTANRAMRANAFPTMGDRRNWVWFVDGFARGMARSLELCGHAAAARKVLCIGHSVEMCEKLVFLRRAAA